ncbi:MAG: endonuclease, partial [Amycolatopsis sp.]|nr:endonuclease [Amycolatopsis sp.]MCU1686632.1 endonuclease [Amycolatopsis sp.]
HSDWSMRMVDGVPEFIPPKWLDQEQKPIHNTAHDRPYEHAA